MPSRTQLRRMKEALGFELLPDEHTRQIEHHIQKLVSGDILKDGDQYSPDPLEMGDDDVKNVIYVNFKPTTLDAEGVKRLQKMSKDLTDNTNYVSFIAGQNVHKRFEEGKLPKDTALDSQMKRTGYRAKVIDTFLSSCPWIANVQANMLQRHFSVRKAQFHAELLLAVLDGFKVDTSVHKKLEGVLKVLSDSIFQTTNSSVKAIFYMFGTVYTWDEYQHEIVPSIRTFYFEADNTIKRYVAGKATYDQVEIDLGISLQDWNFNSRMWDEGTGEKIRKILGDASTDFINNPIDVPVD